MRAQLGGVSEETYERIRAEHPEYKGEVISITPYDKRPERYFVTFHPPFPASIVATDLMVWAKDELDAWRFAKDLFK